MASTAASNSPKPPTLSYAERARKAQGLKPPVVGSTTSHIGNTSSGPVPSTSTGITTSAIRSTPSSGADALKKAINSDTGSSLPSTSAMPSSAVTGQVNGESRLSSDPDRKTASGATPQQQAAPKAPVPNIWNVRKEQLAASRPTVPSTPASASTTGIAKPQPAPTKAPAPAHKVSASNSAPLLASSDQANTTGERVSSGRSHARPGSGEMAPPEVIAIDSEAWPEVGKQNYPDHHEMQVVSKDGKDESSAGSKKGEKPKWIPIPAAELQAAADAVLKTSKSQSRRTSRGPSRNNQDGRAGSTRNPSGRNSTSQSATHSRVHSRSGSVQSSPRFSRGRRLPGEEGQVSKLNGSHAAGSTGPSRYSRHGSPQRPNPSLNSMPEPQHAHSTDAASGIPPSHPLNQHPSAPPQPYMMYPPPPGFHHMPVAYPLGSSNASPSAQPPMAFPHGPPYPQSYPMYGGYDYGTPPIPPMYWNGAAPPRSGQHSPAYPPPFHPDPSFQSSTSSGNATSGAASPPLIETSARAKPVIAGEPSQAENADSTLGEKPVLFGSIGIAVSEAPPEGDSSLEGLDKSFSKFSIGVSQGDIAPGLRSRSKSNKEHHRPSDETGGNIEAFDSIKSAGKAEGSSGKWEFGTTNTLSAQPSDEAGAAARLSPMSGSVSPAQLPMVPGATPPVSTRSLDAPVDIETEFKVKNFGYGFGRPAVPPASGEPVIPDPYIPRYDGDRQLRGDGYHYGGRGRRSGPREEGFDRDRGGGRGGRRGRGSLNGGGYGGRGQGGRSHMRNGSFQGPPRQQPFINGTPPSFQHPISHSNEASPPGGSFGGRSQMAPYLPPHGYDTYGLSPSAPAMNPPTSHLRPPVPVPLTTLSFPLDPTRYYLLGQLEYYLSAQNMAQDFFLRQRMDARGWIAIPLIASFNRVRQLTMDINIVREVLCISSIVQVLDNWVRMGGWEQWVLPDASPSSVDEGEVGIPYAGGIPPSHYGDLVPSSSHLSMRPTIVVDERGHMHKVYATDGQEEEEDEVEFVMGKDS